MNRLSLAIFVLFGLFISSCGTVNNKETSKNENDANADQAIESMETENQNKSDESPEEEIKFEDSDSTIVKISTQYGDMYVYLYDKTPLHKANFIKLANENFYDGTIFHRVIKNFMIQGGDPESKNATPEQMLGNGGPGYTIPAEIVAEYHHKKGALAAARLGDAQNPKRESSGSQFYIVQGQPLSNSQMMQVQQMNKVPYTSEQKRDYTSIGGTPHLDGSYTVFGEVIKGLDVIDKIAAQPTARADRPVKDIEMTVEIIKE
jgi:peptidyl-prolyl cis-trans isomerase B (cyclophilin B)